MGLYGLAMVVLRPELLAVYEVAGTRTGDLAFTLLLFAAVWAPFDGIQVVSAHLLRSVNLAAWASWAAAACYWGVALPLCLILAFPLRQGAQGIWAALALSLAFAALAMGGKFARATRAGAPGWGGDEETKD